MADVKAMNLTPLWDNVILEPVEVSDQRPSGLYVPDSAKEKPSRFKVIAAGAGKTNEKTGEKIPMEVKVGDIVFCSRYAGDEFKIENVEYRVVHQDSILAIVKE